MSLFIWFFFGSTVPAHLRSFFPTGTVVAARLESYVSAISAGISTHASLTMVPHTSPPVSSDAITTAIASFAPVLSVAFSSAPKAPASMPVFLALLRFANLLWNPRLITIKHLRPSQWLATLLLETPGSPFCANVLRTETQNLPGGIKFLSLARIASWNWNHICQSPSRRKRCFAFKPLLCKLTSPLLVPASQPRTRLLS